MTADHAKHPTKRNNIEFASEEGKGKKVKKEINKFPFLYIYIYILKNNSGDYMQKTLESERIVSDDIAYFLYLLTLEFFYFFYCTCIKLFLTFCTFVLVVCFP